MTESREKSRLLSSVRFSHSEIVDWRLTPIQLIVAIDDILVTELGSHCPYSAKSERSQAGRSAKVVSSSSGITAVRFQLHLR